MRQEYLPLPYIRVEPDRGAGLRALALVLGGWVMMRAFFIVGDDGEIRLRPMPDAIKPLLTDHHDAKPPAFAPQSTVRATVQRGQQAVRKAVFGQGAPIFPSLIGVWLHPSLSADDVSSGDTTAPLGNLAGVERDYMGQLGPLFLAGSGDAYSGSAAFDEATPATDFAAPLWPMGATPSAPAAAMNGRRFGLYAYLFVRPDAGSGAAATTYGGSQLFLRAHWKAGEGGLGGRTIIYARVSRDLTKDGRAEFAVGGAVQPLAALPVTVHGERRVRPHGPDATAAFISGGVSDVPLPRNTSLNAYAQGGAIWPDGGKSVGFFDGQASLTMPVRRSSGWRADAGVLAAAGGQDDTARLDIGPVVTLSAGQNGGQVQGQVGWRFRVAGDAAPAHGPAVTVSFGF